MQKIRNVFSASVPTIGLTAGIITLLFLSGFIHFITLDLNIEIQDWIDTANFSILTFALIFSIYVQANKQWLDKSDIFLEQSIAFIDKAYAVLKKPDNSLTNDRICWVTAARLIRRAMNLSKKIKLQSHKEIFASEHDYQRHKFNDLLKINGNDLPAEFFFGKNYTLGNIGKSAHDNLTQGQCSQWIPESIVAEIFNFKTFPNNYEEPLDYSKKFTIPELNGIWLLDIKGLFKYVLFRRYFTEMNGKVYSRNPCAVASEQEINDKINAVSKHEPQLQKF